MTGLLACLALNVVFGFVPLFASTASTLDKAGWVVALFEIAGIAGLVSK